MLPVVVPRAALPPTLAVYPLDENPAEVPLTLVHLPVLPLLVAVADHLLELLQLDPIQGPVHVQDQGHFPQLEGDVHHLSRDLLLLPTEQDRTDVNLPIVHLGDVGLLHL